MPIKLFLLTVAIALVHCSPAKNKDLSDGKVLYDQRQEGEWNVRADLQNFIVLVIPTQTQTGTPATGSSPNLLDFLSKTASKRSHLKRLHGQVKKPSEGSEETQHFIESKTAPYHVDISQSRGRLAGLRPQPINAEEIVVAKSPAIALLKDQIARGSRAFVLSVPGDGEIVLNAKKRAAGKGLLKLLGAEHEQCGPGLERDALGICRVVKQL